MSEFYFSADKAFMDYQPYALPGLGGTWRGPDPGPLAPGRYGVALGAAQTFGRFVDKPYPRLLSERLGIPVVNLGIGGVGPGNFRGEAMMRLINGAAFCIVQAMSARSCANDFFNPQTGENVLGLARGKLGRAAFAEAIAETVAKREDPVLTAQYLHALRRAWMSEMYWLSRRIAAPAVLLWFATRDMNYTPNPASAEGLSGTFPHYVDRHTYAAAAPHFAWRVEVVSRRGSPHPVTRDGKTIELDLGGGRTTVQNRYYPSPEMHADAAEALHVVCEELAAGRKPAAGATVLARHGIVRRPVKAEEVAPNFLIVGAAKCGTSAFAAQLGTHPDVFVPPSKELHFFERSAREELAGDYPEWLSYLAYFDGAAKFPLRGEATVAYTMLPIVKNVPQRILSHLGRIPIFYMVRDPLDRVVSHYRHSLRDGRALPPFEQWLRLEETRRHAIDRSNYLMQVTPFLETFGEDRVQIVFHEDYVRDHMAVLRDSLAFLGADARRLPAVRNLPVNRTSDQVPRPEITEGARAVLRAELLGPSHEFLARLGRPADFWPSMAPVARRAA